MKICMLTTSYPRHEGDSRGIFVYKLVRALKKDGVNINVLCPKTPILNEKGGIWPNIKSNIVKAIFFFVPYSIYFAYKIFIETRKCDLIHANWSYTGFLALLSKPFNGKKIVLTERSPNLVSTRNIFLKFFLKFTFNSVDELVTISDFAKKNLVNNHNLKRDVMVIPNGVDIVSHNKLECRRKFGLPIHKKIVTFVGRIVKIKGLNYLIDAIPNIVKKEKNILFVIVGDGDYKSYCESIVRDNNIQDYLKFVGSVSNENVFRYLAASDIFVNPTLDETGGNTIIEALSTGLPVITTKVGWAYDFVEDDIHGVFIKKRDVNDITLNVLKLLRNKELRRRLSLNGKNLIMKNKLTWEKCADKYLDVYRRLLK